MSSSLVQAIVSLARSASVEFNVTDSRQLQASTSYLARGTKLYVSHLPKQSWSQTEEACRDACAAGFNPVPHIPVRLIESRSEFSALIERLIALGVNEVLLIAGDYPTPRGPYGSVNDVLSSQDLKSLGLMRVSFAGHPEGHPLVPLAEIRRAERAKIERAAHLDPTLLTQFFFESQPFIKWVHELRNSGVGARLVAGLAGPARTSTLVKYALRCGVGASVRALTQRPDTVRLFGTHGPERVLRELARAELAGEVDFDGIHLFCFGGFLNTCRWLDAIVNQRFVLNSDSFIVDASE